MKIQKKGHDQRQTYVDDHKHINKYTHVVNGYCFMLLVQASYSPLSVIGVFSTGVNIVLFGKFVQRKGGLSDSCACLATIASMLAPKDLDCTIDREVAASTFGEFAVTFFLGNFIGDLHGLLSGGKP